ncbi:MAG: hypothetical protein IPJ12_19115 [Betaproteobacteria bacterium]|nr:hypothetical protein [Betaproteobacteria bacterium]
MPKYISNDLCRLIRERAYSSGKLALLDQEEAELENIFVQQRQRFREIRLAKKKLIAQLANLDAEITQQLPVDPEDIRSIRNTARFGSKHGSIVRSIVRMQMAQPAPVRTTDMVKELVQEFGWPYASNEDISAWKEAELIEGNIDFAKWRRANPNDARWLFGE